MIVGILILIIFILLGIMAGTNVIIPYSSYQYIAVAILACLDSVVGAIYAGTGKNFKMEIFLSGFFFNALFAIFLVYLGEMLNVEIYLAAVIVFSGRILNNFSIIRRKIMDKAQDKRIKYKLKREKKENILSNNAIKTDVEVETQI